MNKHSLINITLRNMHILMNMTLFTVEENSFTKTFQQDELNVLNKSLRLPSTERFLEEVPI